MYRRQKPPANNCHSGGRETIFRISSAYRPTRLERTQDEHPLSGITTCPEMQDFRPAHPFLAIVLKQHEAWIMLLTKTFSTRLLCRKQCRPHNALPVDPPISTHLATRQDNGSEPSEILRYHIIRNTHRQYKNAQPDKRHTPSRTGCSGTKNIVTNTIVAPANVRRNRCDRYTAHATHDR